MSIKRLAAKVSVALMMLFGSASAVFAQKVGMPTEKGLGFQDPVNQLGRQMIEFHDLLLWVITAITILVFVLLAIVVIRFREGANPVPSKTTHNTFIEIVWTAVPILILVGIAFPSFKLLYYQDTIPETEFAVRITGNQWNWTYSYPDHGGIEYTSVMVPNSAFKSSPSYNAEDEAAYTKTLSNFLGRPAKLNARLLDADSRLVVPVGTKIRVELTASDVIHAWTVPSFGVKLDAVPGRLNATWFEVEEIGTYYGQCSELCGKDHAYMPIAVEVMSKEDFAKWVEHAKAEYASNVPLNATTALGR